MKRLVRTCIFFGAVLALANCSSPSDRLQHSVKALAESINQEMVRVHQSMDTLVHEINAVYDRSPQLDLSFDKLDVAQGGMFKSFQNDTFYYKPERTGASYYVSPWNPQNTELKKELRLMQYVEPLLVKASQATDNFSLTFYGITSPQSIGLLAPWVDMISNFPPGIDLSVFEWYQRGLKSTGPALWSEGPFTDLHNGWVIDLAAPTFQQGKVKGVAVQSVALEKISRKFLESSSENLVLMGPTTKVVSQSPGAKTRTGLLELELVTLIKQTNENTFQSDRYRLTDPTQAPEVQRLGNQILAGDQSFTVQLKGRNYQVFVARIPEIGFYLLGLLDL